MTELRKNFYEEVIDQMMVEEVAGLDNDIKETLVMLTTQQKRLAILSILDNNRDLFLRIRKLITDISVGKTEYITQVVTMLREYVKVSDIEQRKFAEVMTPIAIVEEMLNTLPADVWTNPNLKWLDSCNGVGIFPSVVVKRLMDGLVDFEPNEELRYKHIVENMLYVGELQPKNMFLFLCSFDPKDEYDMNIYTGSFLDDAFDNHMKEVWGVKKFDIIVGNPPYQAMDSNSGPSATPIYNLFVEKCISISDVILYITPSRWFGGGKGLGSFRDMMISSKKIKLLNHFDDKYGKKTFGNSVKINGGVSYFLFDNNYDYSNKTYIKGSNIDLTNYDIILNDYSCVNILNKVLDNKVFLNTICMGRGDNIYRIETNDSRLNSTKISDEYVKCYVSQHKGLVKWIDSKTVLNRTSNKYKIFTSRAADYAFGGYFFIGTPDTVCTGSYIEFNVDTEEEAVSLKSYLETKFVNYLLSLRKVSQDIKPDTCKWIPLVSLDQEWSDEKLYKLFNISTEEISKIESLVLSVNRHTTSNIHDFFNAAPIQK
jgi:hypothetical protein